MDTYFFRIVPPRAMSLPHMRPDELVVIDDHVAYWADLLERGHVLAFGPVADETGNYGVGVIRAESPEQARAIADGDPAVTSTLLSFRTTVTPMHTVMSPVPVTILHRPLRRLGCSPVAPSTSTSTSTWST